MSDTEQKNGDIEHDIRIHRRYEPDGEMWVPSKGGGVAIPQHRTTYSVECSCGWKCEINHQEALPSQVVMSHQMTVLAEAMGVKMSANPTEVWA